MNRKLIEVLAEVRNLAYVAEYLEVASKSAELRVFASVVHAVCVKVSKELAGVVSSVERETK